MYFDEFHNHKWAKNLAHARRLVEKGDYETFYRGEDLPEGDVYPGMRVMAAYWISVEHEMKMRLGMLLKGAGQEEWQVEKALLAQRDTFFERFLDDMRALIVRDQIVAHGRLDDLLSCGLDLSQEWISELNELQASSEAELTDGLIDEKLVEAWFDSCLRSVANYNFYLIWGAVNAAALIKQGGDSLLAMAIDKTAEDFKWEISREFYVRVMPSAGFEDLGDIMELGMRGMFSDQYYQSGDEQEVGEATIKESLLKNCELAGVYQRVAEWSGLPGSSLGYGICRYCEVHGEATMLITMPPMYAPTYRRVESLGMGDKACRFRLTLTPADDMERLMEVHGKVFGTG